MDICTDNVHFIYKWIFTNWNSLITDQLVPFILRHIHGLLRTKISVSRFIENYLKKPKEIVIVLIQILDVDVVLLANFEIEIRLKALIFQ